MTEIRKLPATEPRVETGATQFGDDWPGIFIRGDKASYLVNVLALLEDHDLMRLERMEIAKLIALLRTCRVGEGWPGIGDYRDARGVVPLPDGAAMPEETIRRNRGVPDFVGSTESVTQSEEQDA